MTTLHIADVRARLLELVDDASASHEPIEITNNGRRTAVLMGVDDYDAMRETIAKLSDAARAHPSARVRDEVRKVETQRVERLTSAMKNVRRSAEFG